MTWVRFPSPTRGIVFQPDLGAFVAPLDLGAYLATAWRAGVRIPSPAGTSQRVQ